MTINGWLQIILYCAIVVALVLPLGGYMTRVFNGERTFLSPVLHEKLLPSTLVPTTTSPSHSEWTSCSPGDRIAA
jgi:K+-transporting ATPase ATPase A chain